MLIPGSSCDVGWCTLKSGPATEKSDQALPLLFFQEYVCSPCTTEQEDLNDMFVPGHAAWTWYKTMTDANILKSCSLLGSAGLVAVDPSFLTAILKSPNFEILQSLSCIWLLVMYLVRSVCLQAKFQLSRFDIFQLWSSKEKGMRCKWPSQPHSSLVKSNIKEVKLYMKRSTESISTCLNLHLGIVPSAK